MLVKYEIVRTDNGFIITARFYISEETPVESGQVLTVIKFEQFETYLLGDEDTIESIDSKIRAKAEELKKKYNLMVAIEEQVKGEIL